MRSNLAASSRHAALLTGISRNLLLGIAAFSLAGATTAYAQTFSTEDAASIVDTFRYNELRFSRDYEGKVFDAVLSFKSVEESLLGFSYIARFNVAYCTGVDNPGVLNQMVNWNNGQRIHIHGEIYSMVLGDISLQNCAFSPEVTISSPQAVATVPSPPMTYMSPAPTSPVAYTSPMPAAVYTSPTPVTVTSQPMIDPDFAAFSKGKQQRIRWKTFIGLIVGDEHDGAVWWSGQRSLKSPGSCSSKPSDSFRKGCEEAQALLGPADVLRKTNPAYRAGWNSL